MPTSTPFDVTKFINASQVGGIDAYVIDEGEGRGVRALCVNTGGGLRYRVLVDRGLDIDQAFFNYLSLTMLSHKGVTPPTRALDRGQDWLKGFPVGLLTSCGPTNIGGPCIDNGEELGLHGPHSNTAATIESVIQPDPHAGRLEMSIVGRVRCGSFYGPNIELRRTIASTLGSNVIRITDEFYNAGNTDTPHDWLLHINFGYPLVDGGAEICCDEKKIEPMAGHAGSARRFREGVDYKRIPNPLASHAGTSSAVGYLYPRAGRDGMATVAIVNPRLGLGVAITYNTRQFPRCGNWQHFGRGEYVTALEPMTATVAGRDKDRAAGRMGMLKAGQRKRYQYVIEAVTDPRRLAELRALNGRRG